MSLMQKHQVNARSAEITFKQQPIASPKQHDNGFERLTVGIMRKHQKRALNGSTQVEKATEERKPYTPETSMATPENGMRRYDLMLASVTEDCKRISDLNSREERNRLKREELIPKYAEYITEYLASNLNHPNEVLTHYIVWLFDVRMIEQAFKLSEVAIEQNQSMPERYNRDLKTFVCDEVFDWAEPLIKDERSAEPYFGQVFDLIADGTWTVCEEVQMKFHKLSGIRAESQGELETALALFEKAEEILPKKAQVKTRIGKLRKALEAESKE